MPLTLTPLHPMFGADAAGIDMRGPLAPEDVRAVNAAMAQYGVLRFRGQDMTGAQQVAMAESFGPLDPGLKRVSKLPDRMEHRMLIDISNLGPDGTPLSRDNPKVINGLANQLWHSDSSFQDQVAVYSMLSAVRLPSWGGETEFCDLRVAWDTLPDRLRNAVTGRDAEHFALHSRMALLGDGPFTEEQMAVMPPVMWPLVRDHVSGRTALFVGVHARRVTDMTTTEGRMLLLDLVEHATHPARVWRQEWQQGDLLMWDNRCMLHRGRAYDLAEVRELRRTTTMDPAIRGTLAA